MPYDVRRDVLLYTRQSGAIPDIYASDDAKERFEQICETGRMTLTDWSLDTDNEETFDVDMAALATIIDITRPGVDRGRGDHVGSWRRNASTV